MRNLAKKPTVLMLFQEYGKVVATGDTYTVDTDTAVYQAQRAASCLLDPALGDKVLLVTDTDDGAYVLAVLERDMTTCARLHLPGDTEISASNGQLHISARDGIAIDTGADLGLKALRMQVSAMQAEVTVGELSFAGECWNACIERMKLVGRSFDTVLERCHQRITRSHRFIEEIDQVKAGQIDYQADTSMQLHAKYAMMTADALVKIDGDQIHLG